MKTDMYDLAVEILSASGADVTEKVDIYPLAKQMVSDPRCTVKYRMCRLHIAKAIRRARHPLNDVPKPMGGKREGAGRRPNK